MLACGLLAAEEAARRAGLTLDFGADAWGGDGEEVRWAGRVRALLGARRDVEAEAAPADVDIVVDADESERVPTPVQSSSHSESLVPAAHVCISLSTNSDSDDSLTGYTSPTP